MFPEGVTVKRSDFPIWDPLSKPLKFGVHYQNHSNLGPMIKTTQICEKQLLSTDSRIVAIRNSAAVCGTQGVLEFL